MFQRQSVISTVYPKPSSQVPSPLSSSSLRRQVPPPVQVPEVLVRLASVQRVPLLEPPPQAPSPSLSFPSPQRAAFWRLWTLLRTGVTRNSSQRLPPPVVLFVGSMYSHWIDAVSSVPAQVPD